MNAFTKRQLKLRITKMSITEVISLLDAEHVKGAFDVLNEDLVDMAYLAVHQHERAGAKFAALLRDNRIKPFFSFADCPIPQGSMVEVIIAGDLLICKKIDLFNPK